MVRLPSDGPFARYLISAFHTAIEHRVIEDSSSRTRLLQKTRLLQQDLWQFFAVNPTRSCLAISRRSAETRK
jgi:hypothetical protein